MIRGGTTYRFVTDVHGSVRLVVDTATGAVAQRIDYDAFGRITADSDPGFQPFGYAGGLYDPDTGLTLIGQRDYDAATGRFTSKDPAGFAAGDTNLYAYAFGDPVNLADPTGDGLRDFLGDAAGAIAGGAGSALSAVGNVASAAVNAAPDFVAGALDGLTNGLSTQIAGSVFGFNPSCADFGTAGRIGQGIGTAASMFTGGGEERLGMELGAAAGQGAEDAAKGLKHFSGTEKPWRTGATPGSVYTHVAPNGTPIQNAIYDEEGTVIAHVDFKDHKGGQPPGHAHTFPVPGNPDTGHHGQTPTIPPQDVPEGWKRTP